MERVFTMDEANALLPRLTELLTRLRGAFSEAIEQASTTGRKVASSNGSASAAMSAGDSEHEYVSVLSEVEALGVIVRDADSGLVDFAAVRDGDAVYLCWQLGEERIGFWHPRDTGFKGRQPL
jgi:hypothetical protein